MSDPSAGDDSYPRLLPRPPSALPHVGISDLIDQFRMNSTTVLQFMDSILDSVSRLDVQTSGVTALFSERARARAAECDAVLAKVIRSKGGENSSAVLSEFFDKHPLFGIPVFVKENISVSGAPLRCASKILEGYVCPYNATVIERIESAGAIVVGYTNMDEFAMGSSTEHSFHGPSFNPYDQTRVPGGSSGGSAIVTALGFGPVSLGSDTGGSVRQPAAFCNVYGFKPTYGAVSRQGLVAFGSSLDQISPFARTAEDLVRIMACLSGADPLDSTSTAFDFDFLGLLSSPSRADLGKRFRIGIPWKMIRAAADVRLLEGFEMFAKGLEGQGISMVDVDLSALGSALPAYYVISSAEASSNLSRFDGLKFGTRVEGATREEVMRRTRSQCFGAEVKRRIILGTFALSSGYFDQYYGKASHVRRLIIQEYDRVFRDVDFVLTPTTPAPAFRVGENLKDPVQMYSGDLLTIPPSLAGLPALSLPIPAFKNEPVGAQLVGSRGSDCEVLRFALWSESLGLSGVAGLAKVSGGSK